MMEKETQSVSEWIQQRMTPKEAQSFWESIQLYVEDHEEEGVWVSLNDDGSIYLQGVDPTTAEALLWPVFIPPENIRLALRVMA
jgi:hypothetical protein